MRLHRFFTSADISGKTVFLSEKNTVHQIIHVLRLTKEDEIILCKEGHDARVRITATSKHGIEGEIISIEKNIVEPQRQIVLYCSMLKKENFEMVVQKAIEVGVSEIVPLKTKRTIKTGISQDRLEKIAKEAAEQCGRARIPVIHESVDFSSAFSSILSEARNPVKLSSSGLTRGSRIHGSQIESGMTVTVLFDASGQSARDFFGNQQMKNAVSVNVCIGPEGGWDADELHTAREKGFTILSLGLRTLRAETAAIIGTFLAVSL